VDSRDKVVAHLFRNVCIGVCVRGICINPVYLLFRYDLPQYGSRRKLISPAGMYDEYGEVIMEDDGSYYYSPHESEGEVSNFCLFCFVGLNQYNVQYFYFFLSCLWLRSLHMTHGRAPMPSAL